MTLQTALSCQHKLTFCAGHRVWGHTNRCAHLHGHNYAVFATATAAASDTPGVVVDFNIASLLLGTWIVNKWDYGFLLHQDDTAASQMLQEFRINDHPQKLFFLPYNPTAENLARYLLEDVCPELFADHPIEISEVIVRETDTYYAAATSYEAEE